MGTKSDYVAGTITVTQGSVDFTGTDTLWRVMGFQEGDTVFLKGYQMVIEAGNVGSGLETQLITSNTSGKFTEAWPGESGTFSYRMRYQSNDSRLSAKVSDFLLRTASGNITAIGELEGIENTLIRFTGPGTVELVEQDEVGIQDPNGSLGKLAALTLAANKILNTDVSGDLTQSDITAAALVLLKLAGTAAANKLPYFDAANSAAMADFTAAARALTNLSGTPTADMLPYLTGESGAGLTALTAFARTVLDDTTGSAMFTTMGGTRSPLGNGYQRLPNGTLFQWGGSINPATDYRINFPTAFPTACTALFTINTYDYGGASTAFIGISTSNVSTSGFDARCRVIGNGGSVTGQGNTPLMWGAMGF